MNGFIKMKHRFVNKIFHRRCRRSRASRKTTKKRRQRHDDDCGINDSSSIVPKETTVVDSSHHSSSSSLSSEDEYPTLTTTTKQNNVASSAFIMGHDDDAKKNTSKKKKLSSPLKKKKYPSGRNKTSSRRPHRVSRHQRVVMSPKPSIVEPATTDNNDDDRVISDISRSTKHSSSSSTKENEVNSDLDFNEDNFVFNYGDHYHEKYKASEMNGSITSRVTAAQPPKKRLLRKVETLKFKIEDFERCPHQRGEFILSSNVLKAHGYDWKLQVYPRGDGRSSTQDEYVSCYLHYIAPSPSLSLSKTKQSQSSSPPRPSPTVKVMYRVGSLKTDTQLCTFVVEEGKRSTSWGLENFVKRKRIIQRYLEDDEVDGGDGKSLTIEVDIRIAVDRTRIWYPPVLRKESTLAELYRSTNETGDSTFRVAVTASADNFSAALPLKYKHFKAHKMILALRAKILYELISDAEEHDNDYSYAEANDNTVVEVPEYVGSDTFEVMLEYIYTVSLPNITTAEDGMRMLVAADRLHMTQLKLYVESVLADKFLDESNFATLFVFGDAYSCALLKETAMDLYRDGNSAITPGTTDPSGWNLVKESDRFVSELFNHNKYRKNILTEEENRSLLRKNNLDPDENRYDLADVFDLRERLQERGMDVDGTRETLIERLRKLDTTCSAE